ncbi:MULTISPECIES: stage III sporulation protein AF [Aeribacillus]|uniref:stage III sporulation protein AF n=1 Tax=Aeribacillus TaxID=1055323 RepID=UPI001398927B|nr:stage III sporulation protein AF [Aeribacillus composti]MED0703592.1 stage III sporulation protein AF [Aeribacillus composti]BBU40161.1 stage III sporulation protein AF [Aeribacillus pallidus]
MSFITEWVTNIILFIFIAIILDMLLPRSAMQKYVKVVVSLLLVSVILTPILKIFSYDFPNLLSEELLNSEAKEDSIKKSIEFKKNEIQANNRAYILEQMAVQMKNLAEEELVENYGLKVQKIHLSVDETKEKIESENDLKQVTVFVEEKDLPHTVETVKPVEINMNEEDKKMLANENEIIAQLAKTWGVSKEKISIEMEGGGLSE